MAAITSESDVSSAELYRQLDAYPWDTDEEFQGGLRAILGSVDDPSQLEHLTLRAKCYYYARKANTTVDFNGYKRWVESRGESAEPNTTMDGTTSSTFPPAEPVASPPTQSSTPTVKTRGRRSSVLYDEGLVNNNTNGPIDTHQPATFAEICDMIAEGKPIPGIKDIPNTILEGQASDSSQAQRRKPWERSTLETAAQPSWIS